MGMILALDFGGTKLTAGMVADAVYHTHDLTWQAHQRVYSPADGNAQVDLATMAALAQKVLAGQRATAVGVSFGGPADYHTGLVRLSHHVAGWEEIPLQQRLEKIFAAPVRIDNDANVAALGEWRFGAGQGLADLLYIT
ncbi:MAG TPA: ROK family protein, partial [Chloroflexota bacterium]|nr:ROK family protein [Chloroflexota bacterium]